jgi:hypothetical protein
VVPSRQIFYKARRKEMDATALKMIIADQAIEIMELKKALEKAKESENTWYRMWQKATEDKTNETV